MFIVHLFLAVKGAWPFVHSMGLIRVQLFLAVQNSSFCCLILKIGVSYHIILMYDLNYDNTGM